MIRPDRDRLSGWVEVDETMVGGLEEGVAGRQTESKALVVIAAQADGLGTGRIRMRVIDDASAVSLHSFVKDCIDPAVPFTPTAGRATRVWRPRATSGRLRDCGAAGRRHLS